MANETVLVVDDGKDNREFLVEYVLGPHGFRYLLAKNGEEGLRLALKHQPDIILLDLQMPKLTGLQVLEQLQARDSRIPVILMTFHGSEEIAVEVYRMGVRDYVKKPYYPEEMLEAIENALTETRLRRERDALTDRVIKANQNLQRRVQEMEVIYQIGKAVTSTIDMNELLPKVVDAVVKLTRADEAFIALMENKQVVRRAHKSPRFAVARSVAQAIKDPIVARSIQKQKALRLGPDQLQRNNPNAPMSVACVPLMVNQRVLGALQIINYPDTKRVFHDHDIQMMTAVADYAAIAIENSRNYNLLRTSNEKMRHTFERFVPPSVVQQALADEVELGGQRQVISVLFADIRGYTAFSEKVAPEKVVEILNHYLSVAGNIIIGWEGTLDKFMGDGLMAIFNAPNPQDNHLHRAAEAAIAIRQAVAEINEIYGHDLGYSVGVHIGEAVVGYIGTSYAVNYTAIGDTVNLAKRLQEQAQPDQILVEEAVVHHLGDLAQTRHIGEMPIKGREQPAQAYELIDIKPQ